MLHKLTTYARAGMITLKTSDNMYIHTRLPCQTEKRTTLVDKCKVWSKASTRNLFQSTIQTEDDSTQHKQNHWWQNTYHECFPNKQRWTLEFQYCDRTRWFYSTSPSTNCITLGKVSCVFVRDGLSSLTYRRTSPLKGWRTSYWVMSV